MGKVNKFALQCLFVFLSVLPSMVNAQDCPSYLNHEFKRLHSNQIINLCDITQGKPVLIVNTASNCGFTPQFTQLEKLNQQYKDKGLVMIGFPSDDFFQEENKEVDTAKVCYINYGVTFMMLSPSAVRGSDVNPVFKFLAEQTSSPKWNFYKYIVSGDGKDVMQFNSRVKPESIEINNAINSVL